MTNGPVGRADLLSIDRYVGSRIKARRAMLGMGQEKLASGLGITFQQVQKYEKGANRVSASRLVQIACMLGVSPPYFFDGAPWTDADHSAAADPTMSAAISFFALPGALGIAGEWPHLTPSQRQTVMTVVREMVGDGADHRRVGHALRG
jgi:transcriptional regulator with XRE-family HTH domain